MLALVGGGWREPAGIVLLLLVAAVGSTALVCVVLRAPAEEDRSGH